MKLKIFCTTLKCWIRKNFYKVVNSKEIAQFIHEKFFSVDDPTGQVKIFLKKSYRVIINPSFTAL